MSVILPRVNENDTFRKFVEKINDTMGAVENTDQNMESEVSRIDADKATKAEVEVERQRINNLASLPEGSTTGDAELTDMRVGANGETYPTAGEAIRKQIGSLSEDSERLNQTIFDEGTPIQIQWEIGYIDLAGTDQSNAGNYIRTVSGKYYTYDEIYPLRIIIPSNYQVGVIRYSSDKKYIDQAAYTSENSPKDYPMSESTLLYRFLMRDITISNGEQTTSIANKVKFIKKSDGTNGLIGKVSVNTENIEKIKERVTQIEGELPGISDGCVQNRLYGKTLVVLGDSMAKGHTLSDEQTWAYKLAERNNMNLTKLAVNGSFITTGHNNDSDCLLEQLKRIEGNPDIIIIFTGTNDRNNNVPLGPWTISNTDTTTLNGALRVDFNYIFEHFTTSKIMFITPYYYQELTDYIGTIEQACFYTGIHCKNNMQGGICAWNENVKSVYFLDQVHLNELGQELASYEYEGFLRTFV